MFWKKNKPKKRVICPLTVVTKHIEDTVTQDWDTGFPGFDVEFKLNDTTHKVGCSAELGQGKWGKEKWHSQVYYLDLVSYNSFAEFKENAQLNGELFFDMDAIVEVVECDGGMIRFPWYECFEPFVVIEQE